MADEYAEYEPEGFDDEPVEFTRTGWKGHGVLEVPEIEIGFEESITVFQRILDIVNANGTGAIKPLAYKFMIDDRVLSAPCDKTTWNSLPGGAAAVHGWREWMADYTVAQLSKVAHRFVNSVVYSNDEGRAASAYAGRGFWENGAWQPDGTTNPFVVAVPGDLAATAIMAASGVKMKSLEKTTKDEFGNVKQVNEYRWRNMHAAISHPVAVKSCLAPFLLDNRADHRKGTKWRNDEAVKAPMVWEVPAHILASKPVSYSGLTPMSAFYMDINQAVLFPKTVPGPALIRHGALMSYSKYRYLISHTWWSGGVRVPTEWFMAYEQFSHFPDTPWSGNFAKDLPNWAMFSGAKFEGTSIVTGNPALDLKCKSRSSAAKMKGIVWSPTGSVAGYSKAAGIAIPMGDNIATILGPISQWVLARPDSAWNVYVVLAPQPFFVVSESAFGCPVNGDNVKILYNAIVPWCVRNYIINLMWARDPGCALAADVFLSLDKGAIKGFALQRSQLVPGRYCPVSETNDKAAALSDLLDKYHHGMKRKRGEGGEDEGPDSKRGARMECT